MASLQSCLDKERPKVVKYGFTDFYIKDMFMSARCKFCRDKTMITDKLGTTSNFVKHLQWMHPQRYVAFFTNTILRG